MRFSFISLRGHRAVLGFSESWIEVRTGSSPTITRARPNRCSSSEFPHSSEVFAAHIECLLRQLIAGLTDSGPSMLLTADNGKDLVMSPNGNTPVNALPSKPPVEEAGTMVKPDLPEADLPSRICLERCSGIEMKASPSRSLFSAGGHSVR